MRMMAQLANLKKETMKKIAEAAAAHDTKLITSYSALANRIEADERTLTEVLGRISGHEKEVADPTDTSSLKGILDGITTAKSRTRKVRLSSGKEEGSIATKPLLIQELIAAIE